MVTVDDEQHLRLRRNC